jgi:hypothetical protein
MGRAPACRRDGEGGDGRPDPQKAGAVSTPRKHDGRRVGGGTNPDPNGPRDAARLAYLVRLTRLRPAVLWDLRRLYNDAEARPDATVDLEVWATKYGLRGEDDWPIAYAKATLAGWRDYASPNAWFDRDDHPASWAPDNARPVIGPLLGLRLRPGEDAAAIDPLTWTARIQLGDSYTQIARDVGRDRASVWEAVERVARFIGLRLRPSVRGPERAASWVDIGRVRDLLPRGSEITVLGTTELIEGEKVPVPGLLAAYNKGLRPAKRITEAVLRREMRRAGFTYCRQRRAWIPPR